jgi:hypothetical protein
MQEHIRRAHPEYYIPKLPATKESFDLMINSPPHEKPAQDPNHANHHHTSHPQQQHHLQQHSDPSGLSPAYHFDAGLSSSLEGYHALGQHDGGYYTAGDPEAIAIYNNMQAQQQRSSDEYRRGSLIPAASAAAALAQLHYHRPDSESGWGGDSNIQVNFPVLVDSPTTVTEADLLQNYYNDTNDYKTTHINVDPALQDANFMHEQSYAVGSTQDQHGLLPSSLARSPTDRNSTTLPPLNRSVSRSGGTNRPRRSSLTSARVGKHERKRSKEMGKQTLA